MKNTGLVYSALSMATNAAFGALRGKLMAKSTSGCEYGLRLVRIQKNVYICMRFVLSLAKKALDR